MSFINKEMQTNKKVLFFHIYFPIKSSVFSHIFLARKSYFSHVNLSPFTNLENWEIKYLECSDQLCVQKVGGKLNCY